MPTSKPGVDLSLVGDKGFQGSCSAGLAAEVIPPAAAHSLVSDHTFSAEVHRGVFVFLMIVEMLENSLLCQWGFGILAREQNPLMEQGIILSSGLHCLKIKTFICCRIILWK